MQSVELYSQHPGQRYVYENARRLTILSCGRRWRKSTLAMTRCVLRAAQFKETVIWGAPTADQVDVCWQETKKKCDTFADFRESKKTAHFPGGGKIIYRSLDNPNNARGHSAHGAVIDEAAFVDPTAYTDVIQPMLMDTKGWCWLLSTPDGRNWFWQEYVKAQYDKENTIAIQVPTVGCEIAYGGPGEPPKLVRKPHPLENPFIDFAEIEKTFRNMPERSFRQEIMAEFMEDGGAVFRGVDAIVRRNHPLSSPCGPDCPGYAPHPVYEGTFVAGLDWGKENDYTDMSVWDAHKAYEVDHMRINRFDFDYQREVVKAMYHKWKIKVLIAEQNSIGTPNIEELRKDGLYIQPYAVTPATKRPLIEALALAIETGKVSLLDIPENEELKAYQIEKTSAGNIKYNAPRGSGIHDDAVISRALAYQGCLREPIAANFKVY